MPNVKIIVLLWFSFQVLYNKQFQYAKNKNVLNYIYFSIEYSIIIQFI